MTINKKIIYGALGVLAILLGILAMGQIDYTISKEIVNKNSIWAEFFNMFGELPANLGLLIGTGILYGIRNREVKWKNAISSIFGIFFMMLFSFMSVFIPIRYIFEFSKDGVPTAAIVTAGVLAIILFLTSLFIINKLGKEKLREVKKIALVLILLVVLEIIIVNVLKIVWGRPRMRSMESFEQFKYWFQINGPALGEEFKSFPSGHTANGFVMIAYSLFLPYFKKINEKGFMIFAIVWGSLVALSRVVLGAHFLSDVLIGGYITIFTFYGLNFIFFKKTEIKEKEVLEEVNL